MHLSESVNTQMCCTSSFSHSHKSSSAPYDILSSLLHSFVIHYSRISATSLPEIYPFPSPLLWTSSFSLTILVSSPHSKLQLLFPNSLKFISSELLKIIFQVHRLLQRATSQFQRIQISRPLALPSQSTY